MSARDKLLTIKISSGERSAWQQQAAAVGLTLSDFVRNRMSSPIVCRAPRRQVAVADPALLAAIARAGNNLNQIARWSNTYKSSADAAQVLIALAAIERQLSEFLRDVGHAN